MATSSFVPTSSSQATLSTPSSFNFSVAPPIKNTAPMAPGTGNTVLGGAIPNGFTGAPNPAPPQAFSMAPNPQAGQQTFSSSGFPTSSPQPANIIKYTPSGGAIIPSTHATAYSAPATSQTNTQSSSSNPDLNQFIIQSNPTSGGGTLSTDGSGNPTGYTAGGQFSIPTDGSVSSDALTSNTGAQDLSQTHSQYSDYVNAVAQAQGYSPDYIAALQGQYAAQTQQAQLGLNSAMLNSNLYTGDNLPGDTMAYAQGATAKAQAQNTLEQSQNSIQQLSANQALNTAQLARTGNIAAAQTELQYSPTGMAGSEAISQYNALGQQYPGANIPPLDPNQDPQQQLQQARQLIANSPAYQAQFQSTYSTPGGGTGIYNKLSAGSLPQNSDGTLSLVSGAQAAAGGSNATNYNALATQVNALSVPYQAANQDFTAMTDFMQKAGINQQGVPIINQIENAVKGKTIQPGSVAAFQTYIQSLRAKYTQLLGAAGETPTDAGKAAAQLIPDTLGISDMQQIQQALNTNGKNIIDATQQRAQSLYQSLQGGTPQSAPQLGGTSGGTTWPGWNP